MRARLLAAGLLAGGALAASGLAPVAVAAAPVPVTGQLVPRSCLVDADAGDAGTCTKTPGLRNTAYLGVSGDGRNVYVTARESDTIMAFARDARTGALKRITKRGGCFVWAGNSSPPKGCTKVPGIDRPSGVAISPDGGGVYVTGNFSDSVAAFKRDRRTGTLTALGCFSGATTVRDAACAQVPALDDPIGLTVSPDNRHLYVSSWGTGGLNIFKRTARTAKIDYLGCLRRSSGASVAPCATVEGSAGLNWVALSRDGRNLYATAAESSAVLAFARDPVSGGLTAVGCVSGNSNGAGRDSRCASGRGILGPQFLAVSADGRFIYATGSNGSSLALFARGAGGVLIQHADPSGCLGDFVEGADDCDRSVGLDTPFGIALDPAGANVYIGSYGTGAVDAFRRDAASGLLRFLGPCFAQQDPLCTRLAPLQRAGYVEVSPDGRNVYVNAPDSSAVHVFARKAEAPPVRLLDRRLVRRGAVIRPRISCPRTAVLGCFGEVAVRVIDAGGHAVGRPQTVRYDLKPGRRARLNVHLGAPALAILAATRVDAVRVDITSREPAGDAFTSPFLAVVTGR